MCLRVLSDHSLVNSFLTGNISTELSPFDSQGTQQYFFFHFYTFLLSVSVVTLRPCHNRDAFQWDSLKEYGKSLLNGLVNEGNTKDVFQEQKENFVCFMTLF